MPGKSEGYILRGNLGFDDFPDVSYVKIEGSLLIKYISELSLNTPLAVFSRPFTVSRFFPRGKVRPYMNS